MQQKENCSFQGILPVQKERFDLVKWVNHAAKRELHFLGDIDYIEKKVRPGKMEKACSKKRTSLFREY